MCTQCTDLALRGCNIDGALPAAALTSGTATATDAPRWVSTLQQLTTLDVSDACSLAPKTLAVLLSTCGSLRHLAATGCRTLAAGASADSAASSSEAAPASLLQLLREKQRRLPSLHSLAAGWGFSLGVSAALVDASPFVTRLEFGLGAECTDGLLQRVAGGCHHLQELTLRLAAVGTEGVAAVLASCPKLRVLRVQHCAGTLDGAALAAAPEQLPYRCVCLFLVSCSLGVGGVCRCVHAYCTQQTE